MWMLESHSHDQINAILQRRQLTALFQPIISLSEGVIVAYEGLIRGPSDSLLHAPNTLFKVAQECELRLDLELLCHSVLMQSFLDLGLKGRLFLNISPDVLVHLTRSRQVHTKVFVPYELCAKRQGIVLELTEGDRFLPYTSEELAQAVRLCASEGFPVAIDDLGEGFSSLRLWSELRPAYVKIDRHFVQNIEHDPVKTQFVRSIVEIAQSAQCTLIAEGIESESEMRLIKKLGVQMGQGYYFSRPHTQPISALPESKERALRRLSEEGTTPNESVWGRDTLVARQLILPLEPVTTAHTNEEVFLKFKLDPQLDSIPVVRSDHVPVGLITRSSLIGSFAQPYRHELYGKKSCTLHMDSRPMLVDKTSTVQEISRMLGNAERRHLVQGFIVTDNGRYFGFAHGHDLLRVITEMQIQAAKYANPLTQLPGNVPIHEHLDGLLRSKTPFCACYCDLDHFKPYNDVYGFSAGDSVIQMTANILAEACDRDLDFLGHIGGDDFIILFQSADWESRCHHALQAFEVAIQSNFTPEDVKRGGYYTENRRFEKEFHPLTSLSIGAILVPPGLFSSYMEVSRVASGAKKQAKQIAGNSLFVNRRLDAPGAPVPLHLPEINCRVQ